MLDMIAKICSNTSLRATKPQKFVEDMKSEKTHKLFFCAKVCDAQASKSDAPTTRQSF